MSITCQFSDCSSLLATDESCKQCHVTRLKDYYNCCVVDVIVVEATTHVTYLSHLTNHESHLCHVITTAVTSHSRPMMTSHAANTSK